MVSPTDFNPRGQFPSSPRSVSEALSSPIQKKIKESSLLPLSSSSPSGEGLLRTIKEGILDEDHVEEVAMLMTEEEHKIERQLSRFSLNESEDDSEIDLKELIASLKEIEEWEGPFKLTHGGVEEGINFLKLLFPDFVLDQMPLEERKERLGHIASLSVTLSGSLQMGARRLYVICKSKILKRTKAFLKEFKRLYGEGAQDSIKAWELQIQLEEKKLKEEQLVLFVNTTSSFFSFISIPLRFLPQAVFIDKLRTNLSCITSAVQLIGSFIDLAKERRRSHLLHNWSLSFNQLKAHFHPSLVIIKGEASSFQQTAADLLQKRKRAVEKKREWLTSRFEGIIPKIKKVRKERFLHDLDAIEKILSQETLSLRDVEDIHRRLQKTDLLTPPLSPAAEAFMASLNHLKEQEGPFSGSILREASFIQELTVMKQENHLVEAHIERWFSAQSRERLIDEYIDSQETIEIGVKNALNQLIEKKHEMAQVLQSFSSFRSHVYFALASAGFAISLALAILGLLTLPAGGLGLALLTLSLGGSAISVSFLIASYCRNMSYKPETTQTLTASMAMEMAYCRLRNSIASYNHLSYEKKLSDVAKILYELDKKPGDKNPKKYQQALANYQKAKKAFEASEQKVSEWNRKMEKIEKKLLNAEWKDFAQYSGLIYEGGSDPFDALQRLEEVMKSCDFRLLSAETRKIFEVYLGIDLKLLQIEMQKNPQAISSAIENFFGLSHSLVFDFIRKQTLRLEQGLVS